ncbi:uncharacterized protein LOC115320097 [Ixodes scapularis]|uniref:uncharacterized protein LOC115320097 n=1 Tax=Ixodes scapularis TaxID=6945 RepID=UPI001A9F9C35|nr:uncharacterized protein LOC115320097 [Ixodes scapularis]
MPFHCCVPLCKQKGLKDASGNKVSLFAVPSDPALRKKWVVATKRDEGKHFSIMKYTKVCSGHFREGDYIANIASKRHYLTQEAVPSIFAFNIVKRPLRKKPRVRQAPPSTLKFSSTCAGVTNDAIADPSSQDAISEFASEVASYAFVDLTGGHAAPGASSQKNASGEIVTVNAMEDFNADFMCHAVATEDSVVNDCNIDDCVNAATGAVLNCAGNEASCQTGSSDLPDSTQMSPLQDLQELTESQAKLIQDLELELERCNKQLRGSEDALSKARSELQYALS